MIILLSAKVEMPVGLKLRWLKKFCAFRIAVANHLYLQHTIDCFPILDSFHGILSFLFYKI